MTYNCSVFVQMLRMLLKTRSLGVNIVFIALREPCWNVFTCLLFWQTQKAFGGEMRYTFKPDDCMVITIPLGNLRNTGDGHLMPEKFTCVFKDAYKVFLKGRPKELGVRATFKCIILPMCLVSLNICRQKSVCRNTSI